MEQRVRESRVSIECESVSTSTSELRARACEREEALHSSFARVKVRRVHAAPFRCRARCNHRAARAREGMHASERARERVKVSKNDGSKGEVSKRGVRREKILAQR